jgi:hypothetical protein
MAKAERKGEGPKSIADIVTRLPKPLIAVEGQGGATKSFLEGDVLKDSYFGYRSETQWIISNDDAAAGVSRLPANFVDCVVTSPPYYWQRDYGVDGQTGQEDSLKGYVEALRKVFREVLRVLKPTGTAFVVLGDTYYSGRGQPKGGDPKQVWRGVARQKYRAVDKPGFGVPKKSLLGVPWRVALGLQQDGWVIRSSVVWRKIKPLAEPSVRDRPWTTTETARRPRRTRTRPWTSPSTSSSTRTSPTPPSTSGPRRENRSARSNAH